ncbi:hypothetical protein CLU79DRAFT_830929 [Phycomyces nitens]|nr:hypothetical protein CLU79DRAFT_830929 [Phycomyces nitens]
MENWTLQNTSGSVVDTVNGLVNNTLWKFQSLDSLGLSDDGLQSTDPLGFDHDGNPTDEDDFQQEVDKLFQCGHLAPLDFDSIPRPTTPPTLLQSQLQPEHPTDSQPQPEVRVRMYVDETAQQKRSRSPTSATERKVRLRINPPPEKESLSRSTTAVDTPDKPQLRFHVLKQFSPHIVREENKDPMKPDLDEKNLRRLTVATLRTLGVHTTVEELPPVDIAETLPTDSQQVLPAAAMQVITAMILGTSGDKDVAQTVGSQISNGDLAALQRMIVAGLRARSIVIHTTPSIQPPSTDHSTQSTATFSASTSAVHHGTLPSNVHDISGVKYEPPTNVTRLFLRLYRFIINMLLSTPDCWPFIQPVPATAVVYHQEVQHPMDLFTIEQNVWQGKYRTFAKFEQDMQLVWKNAKVFHRNAGTIPKHAENLEQLFYKIILYLKRQIRQVSLQNNAFWTIDLRKQSHSQGSQEFKFDTSNSLPEESDFSYPPLRQIYSKQSKVYTISAISPFEAKAKKPKGLTNEKQLYLQLNGPFFQAVERMKLDPFGNHSIVPRFYIAKNRTLLRQVKAQGVLAIFYNTKANRTRSKRFQIETDIILAHPVSDLFDIDQINVCTDDFSPKGWVHLRPLKVLEHITFEVNESIDRDYFRRMFATCKMMSVEEKNGQDTPETRQLLEKIVCKILGIPEDKPTGTPGLSATGVKQESTSNGYPALGNINETKIGASTNNGHLCGSVSNDTKGIPLSVPGLKVEEGLERIKQETSPTNSAKNVKDERTSAQISADATRMSTPEKEHAVWKKLLAVCQAKGIEISNIEKKYTNINWSSPNSEGFFKQVYFLENVVVQTFRQMTMYQRITEVACLMKLKNLPHMAQMKAIIYNNNGDIAGLSMERYQTTLKQYTHVHSHHRLSAYQKFEIIHQMLICMKTIHEAGLAHRDLSEVNIMINTIDGQLEDGSSRICMYLIDFGKAVFCESQDVRDWFVDVPRASWEYDGDVVPETEEELATWCESLPWVKGKPDHGYRMYRSIQTLPKTRSDNQVLPWLIHPQAEDMYSIGVMMWKVFAETEPWRGILDTDLQGLRYVAEDDYRIQRALEREVHGELSRQLLLKCLKTRPQNRDTASEILSWIEQETVKAGLLAEWKMYSSDTRSSRKAKSMYGFEDIEEEEKRRKRRKPLLTGSGNGSGSGGNGGGGRGRGRPRTKHILPESSETVENNNHRQSTIT